jgi:hypothetical protein
MNIEFFGFDQVHPAGENATTAHSGGSMLKFTCCDAVQRSFPASGQAQVLQGIHRGYEKECLRVDASGNLAQTPHPARLGSKLTHPWITTDYSEALLEFITPPSQDPSFRCGFCATSIASARRSWA